MVSRLRTLGKETVIYGLSTVLARLLNFLLTPYYTHMMPEEAVGVIGNLYAYIAFLTILFQYGMDQAYMRFSRDGEHDERTVFSTAFWPLLGSSLALALLLWLFRAPLASAGRIGEGFGFLVAWAGVVMALDALMCVPFAKLRMEHRPLRYAGIKTVNIVVNVLSNILLLGVFHMGRDGRGPLAVMLSAVIASAVSLLLLSPVIAGSLHRVFKPALFSGLWRFGWPLLPAALASTAVNVIDRPILAALTDNATVGVYTSCYKLGIFMMLLVTMFDQAWRPFFLESAGKADSPILFARVFTYFALLGTGMALALALFCGDAVMLLHLFPASYFYGLGIVPVILAGYLLYGFYVNFLAGPVLVKRTGIIARATIAGAAANVAANLLLIPHFSMLGAAWATFISYGIMAAVVLAFARRVYPIPYEWHRVGHILLSALALWIIAYAAEAVFCDSLSARLAAKAVLLALWPVALYLNGFFSAAELGGLGELFHKARKPAQPA